MKRLSFILLACAGLAGLAGWGQETNPNWAVGGTVLLTNGYVLHTFTNAGVTSNFVVTRSIPIPEIEVLVVGGGGHGAGLESHHGGGGAGGVVHGKMEEVTGSTNNHSATVYSG